MVGRHNSSSPLMFRCWFIVMVFHNIFSLMTELIIYIKCYHVHMWEVIQVKRVANFSRTIYYWIIPISWNVWYGFNNWHANCTILAKFGDFLYKSKENVPKQFIICDTCFTSLATIGGNLFTRHTNNLNRLHKDSNDLLSVIIILGENFMVA